MGYSFQIGSSSSPIYFHIFFLIAFLEEAFIRNIIIILYMNYTVIICFNDYSNAVINNNYGRLKEFIMLFKISIVTQNNFFGLYGKFGHAPSKISPAVA